ncbi:MAG TPA: hypothetical protein VGO40_12815 [Longimicrobium sp.]|nr:hypothetical protein [Longimicrobium sp.]
MSAMTRPAPRLDPNAVARLVASFTTLINGALGMVLAIDAALVALLADGALHGDGGGPMLPATIVPGLLLLASLVYAGLGLVPRRHEDQTVAAGTVTVPDAASPDARRFIGKWAALKRAALLLACALVWRFVAIRLF